MQAEKTAADSVGCQHHEKRIFGQNCADIPQQGGDILFHAPDLTLGTAPVFGRVEDNALILPPAPGLTLDETAGILGDEADRGILHPRRITVGEGLGNGFFGRIYMRDLGPGAGGVQAGHTGITEKIKHRRLVTTGIDPLRDATGAPVPMRGLFGEKAEMAKRGRHRLKGQAIIMHAPCFGQVGGKVPFPGLRLIPFASC